MLVLIKHNGEAGGRETERDSIIGVPAPDTMVQEGDILMIAGSDADLARLPQE
jgi:Trk K+ transport system NAD-binding subunit